MAEWLLLAGIGVLALCLVVTLLALLLLSGLFESFEIKTGKPPLGEAVIAYMSYRGPYKECGPMFTQICGMVPQGYKILGIYYDDPNVVEAHKLRYIVGAILSEDGSEIDMAVQEKLTQNGYKIAKLPAVSYAVNTSFPYRSALSILIAVWRVYPRMNNYVKERKLCAHPYLEVYDGENMYFIAPLARQNEFYVPEVQETEDRAEDGDDEDDSSVDESVSESRETTFSRSVMDDDVPISDSDSEEDVERETTYPTPDTCHSQELLRGEFTPRKLLEDVARDESTPDVSEPRTFQDSEFNSEQTSSSQIPECPQKEEECDKASNASGSSFEEIMMENVPLPQNSS
ncbi:testis-expressed protein 264 homolog [Ostrea edulis]|uniref:testis-expressed protein 264 homolog n=1 Tax=Ostrea edulis TaxID=37623 RepID=UPI0024AF0B3E|nr:testis-expressed protein 264 homolog [Ostrea edulis]